ncbi:MAG: DotU family type IV/VI secretion system protein [Gemmatimonadota bacterium]|nr:DotU family type IV/VI secretion system protein [Gemmatimonadota bacterium]MDQ8166511.1 DotU family type IV/VI secretion system protein [Gemmatimonadota bacterium]MDQ8172391.1 DotU family type IV/VI secretion system protein [Gemmatimonadota bacterium]
MSASTIGAPGRLARALQESLTAVVRLRADRQPVTDAAAFRGQIIQLLTRAEQEALQAGFPAADARLAIFAVVAFLDESVLNTRTAALADWARRPLQDELFGGHMGGEWFFQHIDQLLARPDSPDLADLLEVHQLCLLLGFRGKYGAGDNGQLHATTTRVAERLGRLRGAPGDLAPHWRPPTDRVDTTDPWLRRLTMAAIASAALLVVLWGTYAFLLRGAAGDLRALAPVAVATGTASAR